MGLSRRAGGRGFRFGLTYGLSFVFSFGWCPDVRAASLDQLAAMQTLVRAEIEGTRICEEELRGVSASAISGLPQLLEAQIREKLGTLDLSARRKYFSEARVATCAARCRCGIYANWIDPGDPVFASERAAFLAEERRGPLGEKTVAKCASANRNWICKHPKFRMLVSEVRQNVKGNGE